MKLFRIKLAMEFSETSIHLYKTLKVKQIDQIFKTTQKL